MAKLTLVVVALVLAACSKAAECPPAPACTCEAPVASVDAAVAPVVVRRSRPHAFALTITGGDANPDKRQRCLDQVRAAGGRLDSRSPVRVELTMASPNALRIFSTTRGALLHTTLPPWPVADLCREVVSRANAALAREVPGGL